MESLQDPSSFKQPVPADESQFDLYTIPSKSGWFSWDDFHETEKTHLKEFFDFSSITRTPKIYKEYRDFIISKYREDPSRRLTFTEVRKSLVGDIGLLHKVFLFLESWGLINFGLSPESSEVGNSGEEASQGRWKVRVEEGAPNGVRVVAVPNSLKPVTVPPVEPGNGGEGVEVGFKLPPLASYRDVYSEKKTAICGQCKQRCESKHYECIKDASFIICTKCYMNENYGENRFRNDFKSVECIPTSEDGSALWTEEETLLLLESVLRHGNDWNLVVENVKTKSKADCISKLLQMPFGDLMLGSTHGGGRVWEKNENLTNAVQGQVASSEFQSDKNIKTGNDRHDVKSDGAQNGDNGNQVPGKRRKLTTSPSHMTSSLMKQVAAISSVVGPVITASAADAAVSALCDEYQCSRDIFDGDDNEDAELGSSPENGKEERTLHVDGSQTEKPFVLERVEASSKRNDIPLTFRLRAATATALGSAAAHAKLLADQEEREIEYLMATVIDQQLKKLQYKMTHFDELELIMEKEHAQLEKLKESMIQERLDVLRRVFDSGISRWKNLAPVKSQVDNVL